jgi:TolB-like protein
MLQGGKLAVLDFRNFAADLKPENVRYFADRVREATLQAAPRMEVMTRENLLVLLQASGKDLAQCEGECEVDTGRRIGADAIISGEIQKLGSSYKITMRLHETHAGRLLGASVASGTTLDELDASAAQATARLLEPLSRPASPPAEPVQTPGARY